MVQILSKIKHKNKNHKPGSILKEKSLILGLPVRLFSLMATAWSQESADYRHHQHPTPVER